VTSGIHLLREVEVEVEVEEVEVEVEVEVEEVEVEVEVDFAKCVTLSKTSDGAKIQNADGQCRCADRESL
jgi:hypothetical protein